MVVFIFVLSFPSSFLLSAFYPLAIWRFINTVIIIIIIKTYTVTRGQITSNIVWKLLEWTKQVIREFVKRLTRIDLFHAASILVMFLITNNNNEC